MSNTTKGPFMQAMEKYTKSIKTFISAQGFGHYSKPNMGRLRTTARDITSEEFITKTWSGLTSFRGDRIWTDGENIYYSYNTTHYVLDKATSIWVTKTWSGLTKFYTNYIWTDGENIYYSYDTDQYVLDKSTSTWNTKTWTGLTTFSGKEVWTDGENIYHSDGSLGSKQYVLDKATSTWSHKPWIGAGGSTSIYGEYIWTDGENIYHSYGRNDQYVLDKSTSTWNRKTWAGLTNIPADYFSSNYIWTDGENIYCSNGTDQYVLDKSTSTWNTKTWTGLTSFNADGIWTDGQNIYYSSGSTQYILKRNTPTTHEVMGYVNNRINEITNNAVKVYTYHVNPNESDPEDAVTYLDDATGLTPAKMGESSFSYGSWANAWFLPRPCVLKFDGTVDYYLDPNDYSKKTDGTASTIDSSNSTGNVMLEFPKIWVKRVDDGNGARTVSIAPVNVDKTYKCWSNINAENREVDHFYLPAYNGTIHDSKMRSLSGVTLDTTYAPNYTRAQEVTAATANNPTGKNMWYTETWADMCLVYDLLYLMGKSLDVQRTFGQGLSSGSETAMRAYVTGTHNAKGLFYGNISDTSTAVKVLGMENLWGCRWHAVAGLINDNGTLKVKMTYGVADGSSAIGYNPTGNGYLNYGSTYGTNGYVKKMQADNIMGYKIIETAGTDATYYCNYYYTNNSQSNYALLGGSSGSGSYCGFYVGLNSGAGNAVWTIGGALSCRPQVG